MDTMSAERPSESLQEYLDSHWNAPRSATGRPQYFKDGDYVSFFFKDDLCHAQRTNDHLTVYLSDDNGEIVGCKIKGVSQLLKG